MNTSAIHFDDDAWLALVRGCIAEERAKAMRAHLSEGCTECRRAHETWQSLLEIADHEARDLAPESALRSVKAAVALGRRVPALPGSACVAETILDTRLEPGPTSTRGGPAAPRQLLYRAGAYLVDLRIDESPGMPDALIGQIVNTVTERSPACAGVVLLGTPGTVLGQTITNSQGEFQFDLEGGGDALRICMEVPDGSLIDIAVPGNAKDSMGPAHPGPPGDWPPALKGL